MNLSENMLYGKAIIQAGGRHYGPEEAYVEEVVEVVAAVDAEATYLGRAVVAKRMDDMVELVLFQLFTHMFLDHIYAAIGWLSGIDPT